MKIEFKNVESTINTITNQNTFKGYPSFIQVTIGDLIGEGYTEFDTVILAGMYLTDSEKEELKQILESGVYL